MRATGILLCAAALALGWGQLVRADVFVLRSGGTIEGELLNPDQEPRETYEVATGGGGKLVLTRDQVAEVRRKSEAEILYERYLPRMPKSAEGNWIMAEWCRERGLDERREHHLEQVLTHDPDHEQARYALGFTRLGERWVQTDEWMQKQGYVKYKGSWRLPQETELDTRERETESAVKDWHVQLRRWRKWLVGRDARQALEARQNIQQIRDVLAAPALGQLLEEETFLAPKLILIETLGELDCPAAGTALLKCAMEDESVQVQDACWDQLARHGSPSTVASLIAELEGKDNRRVNRAGIGLARMNDRSAILPLIDALVTTHKFKIVTQRGNIGAQFGRPGSGTGGTPGMAFGAGGGGPKIIDRELRNPEVLNALLNLTDGANFQYDEDRWREWYARINTPPNIDLRRRQ